MSGERKPGDIPTRRKPGADDLEARDVARPPKFRPNPKASPAERMRALLEYRIAGFEADASDGADPKVQELIQLARELKGVNDETSDAGEYDLAALSAPEFEQLNMLLTKCRRPAYRNR